MERWRRGNQCQRDEPDHAAQTFLFTASTGGRIRRSMKHGVSSRNFEAGCVIWLTGLSGAGKSTIARELKSKLSDLGKPAFILDGDIVRGGLCSDLSFSPSDRKENVRRISEVSRLFAEAGIICIVALISPYRIDRDSARNIVGPGRFVEVYVNAPVEVCEHRDPKGLY